ncbi:MAG: formate dehydrogenase subunit alpha [bacterium]|nr:formate dehydrogenase subunit alpha [bacterium]MBU1428643.1 formate dehydrogenase subunit alpha [bacterium]MBU2440342.1 formate dehydrogenase subunit alpha [bacterium]
MSLINIMIDNIKVRVEEGITILDAAKGVGIKIPTLCVMPELKFAPGSCRMCVVEVVGVPALVASCAYPVKEGLEIHTNNKRVVRARKMTLEFLLASHPLDCMTCEKSGNCVLEDLAYDFGIKKSRFRQNKKQIPLDENNPFIIRDLNKCVLCGRCVEICNEIQQSNIIDFGYRGTKTEIVVEGGTDLRFSNCVFCGQCVAVCPVGALIDKEAQGKGRTWEFKKVKTTCSYCGCGCNFDFNIKEGKVVKVTSNSESVVNGINLCVKGRFGYDYIHRGDRLTTPLIKKNGKFKKASWEEAYKLISSKFTQIKKENGNNSLAVLSSAKCTNEENYLLMKFGRAVLGTNNVDHCARLCHSATVAGLAQAFGSGAMTNSIEEIADASVIYLTGSNTTENHPIIALEIKKAVTKNGAKLIVADPREIELTKYAALWLRQRPGTDVALFNGLMNVIISEGLEDKEFIAQRTEGYEELKKTVLKYNPEVVEKITGVPAEDIRKAARIYATVPTVSLIYSMGITQHTTGTDNVLSTANLSMLTGNVGKESTGVNPLRGQNNVQGACDLGALPNVYSGYQKVIDPQVQEKFSKAWGVDLSNKVGLTVVEILNAAYEGKIKGIFIMAENPAMSDPDLNHTREALKRVEFLVVSDIFMTETAELADVVLPGVTVAEKDGTITNTERRVQRIRKAVEPVGESKPEWKIICELAQKMGYNMKYNSPAEIMEEIASLTPIYGGMYYNRLEKAGLQWPCLDINHPGTKYLHKDKFTRGKGKFFAVEFKEAAELPDEEYPLILTTGRVLYHFHTGTVTRRSKGLDEIYPEALVEISPDDAKELKIEDGEFIEVASRRGKIKAKAKVTGKSGKGVVFMSFHFREAAANLLTNAALDPVAKIPEYKVCAVKIKKALIK